jgi:hypothetical protein
VHVIWNGRLPSGQSKVFVRSSPDGVTWPAPSATIDEVAAGHQYRLSIASDAGAITAGWIDSRVDPVYDPNRPVGNDARGRSGGPSADFWAARSVDGGRTWVERRVSAVTTNPNLEVYEFGRVGFNGDVTGLAAAGGRVYAVWTDNRDVVGGSDPREPGNVDGNDTYLPCTWSPNATDAVSYASPTYGDGCLSRGGLDQNVYGADLTGDWVAASVSAPASAGGVATGPTGVLAVSGADGRFAALGALVLALAFVVRRLR